MTHVSNSLVEVRAGRFGKGVHAAANFSSGQLVLRGWGVRSHLRTQHSIQVDSDLHVEVDPPIRYVNHSCNPNCGLCMPRGAQSIEIYALRDIAVDEELSLDYATFEYEIDFMPYDCQCGASNCRRKITGFKDLPDEDVARYGRFVAEHLRRGARAAAPAG